MDYYVLFCIMEREQSLKRDELVFEFQFCWFPLVLSYKSYLISLNLSFTFCKVQMMLSLQYLL